MQFLVHTDVRLPHRTDPATADTQRAGRWPELGRMVGLTVRSRHPTTVDA